MKKVYNDLTTINLYFDHSFFKREINRHLALVHEKKKPFKCDVCSCRCFQKCDIEKHHELVHEIKKPLRCDICDYSFFSKSQSVLITEEVVVFSLTQFMKK